jgi:hypothetical protein
MAQFRDAYGLICAFAAVESAEIFADDGFAGERDVIGGGDQVEIDATHYYDWFAHFFLALSGSRILRDPSPGLKLTRRTQDDDAHRIVRGAEFAERGYYKFGCGRQSRHGIFLRRGEVPRAGWSC